MLMWADWCLFQTEGVCDPEFNAMLMPLVFNTEYQLDAKSALAGGDVFYFAGAGASILLSVGLMGSGTPLSRGGNRGPTLFKEGVYVITTSTGQTYVGQSGNLQLRLAAHANAPRFTAAEVANAQTYYVPGGKTAREVFEQKMIDAHGGVKAVNVNSLNVVNPIGAQRVGQLMPPGYTRPGLFGPSRR